jgi:3-deoxy-7-phosphoheptulonate synthase
MAAESVVVHGNPNVILCERGIRTFETATRNTLDLNAVAILKQLTHLPRAEKSLPCPTLPLCGVSMDV